MGAIPKGADLRSIVFRNTLIVLWSFGSWTAVSIIPYENEACKRQGKRQHSPDVDFVGVLRHMPSGTGQVFRFQPHDHESEADERLYGR